MFEYETAVGIKQRFLSERQYLVVILLESEGTAPIAATPKKTVVLRTGKAYVFQIGSVCRCLKYEPYKILDEDGTAIDPIEPGEGLDFQYLFDSDKKDILRNEDHEWLLYHYSIAVQQSGIRIYPQIPPAELMGGWDWLVANQPDPQQGSPYGYVAGREMDDYYNPPISLESLGWKKREANWSYNKYGFYNESGVRRIQPLLNILGRAYLVHPVMDDVTKRKIIAGPPYGPPRTLISLGPTRKPFSLNTPEEWDAVDCYYTIKEAMTAEALVKEVQQ